MLLAVYDAFKAGDEARAMRIFDHFLPLIRFENQPVINLPIRKLLLHLRGYDGGASAHRGLWPLSGSSGWRGSTWRRPICGTGEHIHA